MPVCLLDVHSYSFKIHIRYDTKLFIHSVTFILEYLDESQNYKF